MSKLYFTRAGAKRVTKQRTELKEKLRHVQGQKGEAAQVGGNQWHDNFSFEQLGREEEILNRQIRDINEKIRQMVLVEDIPSDNSRLRIGHRVKLSVDDEIRVYVIGGHEDSDDKSDPPIISYNAPLVIRLIGKEEGDSVNTLIGGTQKRVAIEEISLPENK